jgi:hypothetical protein
MLQSCLKHKPTKLFVIFLLALIIAVPLFSVIPQKVAAQDTTEYYNKSFAWDYNGRHWTWNISIPKALYDAYRAVPDSARTRNGPAGYGYLTTTQDYYVRMLAMKLNETTTDLGYSSYDQVSFVLAFVQSLPYTSDSVTTGHDEYPRFPIETLVDDGGDCEDTSVLFAAITIIMGYGTVYINPPDHYAVGVLGSNLRGTYWEYPEGSNKTYYYCETTGDGFKIGKLPSEFAGQTAYIYPIDESTQFTPNIVITPPVQPSPTEAPAVISTGPTPLPTAKNTGSPNITGPTAQPVLPLSFNLIEDNPVLFVVIAILVMASLAIAIWSVRRPRFTSESSSATLTQEKSGDDPKFCIHCGSSNKGYAAFCEKCGKQIADLVV